MGTPTYKEWGPTKNGWGYRKVSPWKRRFKEFLTVAWLIFLAACFVAAWVGLGTLWNSVS